MDPISKLIQTNKLEDAKKKIKELENQLSEQLSAYNFTSIKNRIERLKKEYINQNIQTLNDIPNANKIYLPDNIAEFESNEQKICYKNINNKKIDKIHCLECKIEDCKYIKCEYIVCENGLTLMNVSNSEIICSVGQIRLVNSENVKLKIFTKTGIYLQNSTGIIIYRLGNGFNNKYDIVCDFTNPLSNKNYIIM